MGYSLSEGRRHAHWDDAAPYMPGQWSDRFSLLKAVTAVVIAEA